MISVLGDSNLHTQDRAGVPGKWHELRDALSAFDPRYKGEELHTERIGYALRTIQGRVIEGRRLVKTRTVRHAAEWKVENLETL